MKKISLKNKDHKPYFTMVDDEDFDKFGGYKWELLTVGRHKKIHYAIRSKKKEKGSRQNITLYLHREIMRLGKGQLIDHIDGNGLNNQKSNLRLATRNQNEWNRVGWTKNKSSKYKGVSWNKNKKKWRAQISHFRKRILIGDYENEKEAGEAYKQKARQLHKEFYKL